MIRIWWPAFLLPALMVVLGALSARFPAEKIGARRGYRSTFSCKSQAAWDFANALAARLLWQTGLAQAALALMLMRTLRMVPQGAQQILVLIWLLVQLASVAALAIPVEKSLRAGFDEAGQPLQ